MAALTPTRHPQKRGPGPSHRVCTRALAANNWAPAILMQCPAQGSLDASEREHLSRLRLVCRLASSRESAIINWEQPQTPRACYVHASLLCGHAACTISPVPAVARAGGAAAARTQVVIRRNPSAGVPRGLETLPSRRYVSSSDMEHPTREPYACCPKATSQCARHKR